MENDAERTSSGRDGTRQPDVLPYADRQGKGTPPEGLLSESDYLALLESIEAIHSCQTLEEFAAGVTHEVGRLIPHNLVGYNEVRLHESRAVMILEPELPPEARSAMVRFQGLLHQHPVITYSNQTGDGQALKISDFLSHEEFHRTDIYQDVYRVIHAEHQIAVSVLPEKDVIIGIACNRQQGDFSERDRRVLNLLRPHIVQAYASLRRTTLDRQERENLFLALQAIGKGVITVETNGTVQHATPEAFDTLARYLATPAATPPRLPAELLAWLADPGDQPFVTRQDDSRLVIRLSRQPGRHLLLLTEEPPAKNPLALYRLTPRETEVLRWMAEGKTNAEIAAILAIAPGTIKLHVERILQKLGVENRTAAALIAHENGLITGP